MATNTQRSPQTDNQQRTGSGHLQQHCASGGGGQTADNHPRKNSRGVMGSLPSSILPSAARKPMTSRVYSVFHVPAYPPQPIRLRTSSLDRYGTPLILMNSGEVTKNFALCVSVEPPLGSISSNEVTTSLQPNASTLSSSSPLWHTTWHQTPGWPAMSQHARPSG